MKRAVILACALALGGCEHRPDTRADKAAVDAGLQRYAQLLASMDASGIAALFSPDGEVVNPSQPPIRGRPAIQKFIESFADFHVLSNSDTVTSTLIDGNTAEQIGVYHQSVRSPQGHLFDVSGRLEIEWVKDASGSWLIQQLATFPTPKT
jgi:uncharacterized protein (TIGR02246 family)